MKIGHQRKFQEISLFIIFRPPPFPPGGQLSDACLHFYWAPYLFPYPPLLFCFHPTTASYSISPPVAFI